jgi:hypothetical protein
LQWSVIAALPDPHQQFEHLTPAFVAGGIGIPKRLG